jgi:two-component system, OmpR family, phosphate regulon response regulator PhoB
LAETPDDAQQEEAPRQEVPQDQVLLYAQDLAAARASMRTLSRRIASKSQGNRTVLIADDDPSLRLLVSTTLSGDEYTILEAENGVEALLQTKAQHPVLVLLDVNMPDLDGLEVCRRIKADPELDDVKIIILTGGTGPADQEAAKAAGADTYLTKPFRPLELLKLIDSSIL